MNIHLCGAYVTQIRKLDKHGNPTGPNLCREPMQITEDNCTNPDHGHPVNQISRSVRGVSVDLDETDPQHPDYGTPAQVADPRHIPLDGQPGDAEYPYNVPCPQCPALAYEYCVVDGPRPGEWTRCAWTHDARSLVMPPKRMQEILKEDTFEANLGPLSPITHTDSAGADATKYQARPERRHSWAPDEARNRINERRFNEPIPCDEDEGP